MNLTMIRSGEEVFVNAECIKGYAFKMAVAGEKSTHLGVYSAADGSPFMLLRCAR